MGHLAPAELELHPHLVALVEKLFAVAQLRLVVMVIDVHTELDLLELGGGVPAGFVLFGRLVLELAVIDDPAHGGIGLRSDLDEVETDVLGMPQGVLQPHDTELLPGGPENHTHLARANPVVHFDLVELDICLSVGRGLVEQRACPVQFLLIVASLVKCEKNLAPAAPGAPCERLRTEPGMPDFPVRQRSAFKQVSGTRKPIL